MVVIPYLKAAVHDEITSLSMRVSMGSSHHFVAQTRRKMGIGLVFRKRPICLGLETCGTEFQKQQIHK